MKKFLPIFILLMMLPGIKLFSQSKAATIDETRESIVVLFSFSMPYALTETNFRTGSGFVAGDGSFIITSHQIINNANGLIIYSPNDRRTYYGYLVWSDSIRDIAVIKAINGQFKPLEIAESENLHLGDETLVFGYNDGNFPSDAINVSWGLISSDPADTLIQTTANVGFASTGGPAVNLQGKVIGTAYAKKSGFNLEGPGMIRNTAVINEALNQVKNGNVSSHPYFGTLNPDAYMKICDAALQGWKAQKCMDQEIKESYHQAASRLVSEALNLDQYYIEARFFDAAYDYLQARYLCMKGQKEEAISVFMRFKQKLSITESMTLLKNPSIIPMNIAAPILHAFNTKEINCETIHNEYKTNAETAKLMAKRIDEFYDYLSTGQPPSLLLQSMGAGNSRGLFGPSHSGISDIFGKSTLLKMSSLPKEHPVRLSFYFPFGYKPFTNNLGLSFGNAGSAKNYSAVFCKYELGITFLQNSGSDNYTYQRFVIPYFDIGIEGFILQMARFSPKPFLTIGWNPAFYEEQLNIPDSASVKTSEFIMSTGSLNFGIDLDLWVTSAFGLSLSYQYTTSFASLFPSLYGDDKKYQFKYSAIKIGIIF